MRSTCATVMGLLLAISGGGHALAGAEEEAEAAWSCHDAHAVAGFLCGARYGRSQWEHLDVRLLDGETAIASGVSARYRSDGGLLEGVAVTYGLRKTDEGWKIFLSATHAPETVLRFR